MTLRERFESVFRGEKPDALAFYGDLTYWYSAHTQLGDLPEAWRGPRGIGQLHRDLGVGEYVPGCCAYAMMEGERVRVETRTEHGAQIVEWHTPVGLLRQRQEYSAPSFSWGYTEHAVRTVDDLKVLRYIMEHRRYRPTPEAIARIDRDYGDGGVPVVAVPGTPLTELNKTWMGVMDMCYLLADEPVEVRKTLDAIAASHDALFAITAACDCRYVMFCENLSAETMAGYFDEYLAAHLTRRVAQMHAGGKKAMIHNDGTLRGTLEKLAATGMDCVDSVVPHPVGDVAISDLRTLAGDDKIILLGGLPGAIFAPPFTAKDMEKQVKEIIRVHKDSGRFMLGVADQVPPNGDLGLVRLVAGLVEEYGRY
jgi:hypothetical protein